jgi:hypothetical protein
VSKLIFALVAAAAVFVGTTAVDRAAVSPNSDVLRAKLTYGALQKYFYRPRSGLYAPSYPAPDATTPSEVWPFSQALAATVAMAQAPPEIRVPTWALVDRLRGLRRYWNTRARPPGYEAIAGANGQQYYDDNAWIGLELVRVNELTRQPFALRRAERIFELLVSGWDDDATHPCAGGVYWTRRQEIRDRNTISTARAAELGATLYLKTRRESFLGWAKHMYGWVARCLLGQNGLFADHIDLHGTIERRQWSYNQGAMIAAAVRLYQATGRAAYRTQAERIADAAVRTYTPFFHSDEPPYFLAIFFDDLALLAQLDPAHDYTSSIRQYADALAAGLDPMTGLVRFGTAPVGLLDQAAAVRVYAALAGGL